MGSDRERGRKPFESTHAITRDVSSRRRILRWILASAVSVPGAAAWPAEDPPLASEFDDELSSATRRTRLPRVSGHAVNLPPAQDLRADGEKSAREKIPVLLFFDLWDCPYCDRALREFLVPMANGDMWRSRAIYRQVEIDKTDPIVGFDGDHTTHRELAKKYGVRYTPTLHLVNARGETLGKPLVGLMTPDFYGAYLEQAINDATKKLTGG